MSDRETATDYSAQAAGFIAGVQQYAALGLPALPDDPEAAAAMRSAGYEVLAEVKELDDPIAVVHVLSEDEDLEHAVRAGELVAALGLAPHELPGRQIITTYRETPETGPVLSGFRPVPEEPAAEGREMTVRCLLLAGDQAELVPGDGNGLNLAFNARWPAAAIAAETGLPLEDALLAPGAAQVVTEYGNEMSGEYNLWDTRPDAEEIYPLARRIRNALRNGHRVRRRSIIVVDDWTEVTGEH